MALMDKGDVWTVIGILGPLQLLTTGYLVKLITDVRVTLAAVAQAVKDHVEDDRAHVK
jgi:hypothetical protein